MASTESQSGVPLSLKNTSRALLLALAFGVLLQIPRGIFTSVLLRNGAPEHVLLAYLAFGLSFVIFGLILFFYDEFMGRVLRQKTMVLPIFALGTAGLFLARTDAQWALIIGMILVALFAMLAMANLCLSLGSYGSSGYLAILVGGLLCSFLISIPVKFSGAIQIIWLLSNVLIVCLAVVIAPKSSASKRFFFRSGSAIPTMFCATLIALCIFGAFFAGLANASGAAKGSYAGYIDISLNMALCLVILIALKLNVKARKIVYWCWLIFSMGFFLGLVCLALPSVRWLYIGSRLVTDFRVIMECLLVALVIMVAEREGVLSTGLLGVLYFIPLGVGIILRHVAAPAIGNAAGGELMQYLPALTMLIVLSLLFFQYAYSNRSGFEGYFDPVSEASGKTRTTVLDTVAKRKNLTPRERDVLDYLAQGYTMKATADRLFISLDTIRAHVKSIYLKLDVHSKQDLIEYITRQMGE